MTSSRTFPPGFVWGTAAAAYQIEGAVAEGGRGPSIWDTFSHTPGKVDNDDTGDIACDHYNRWPGDLDLMAELGIASYRFSVSWPRVMPDGRTVNAEGVEFYDRLVDGLLERGIQPLMTLYHWDLPQALEDEGGWLNRDIADRFTDYALTMGKAIGDRTPAVTTLNEPWCSAYLGYASGEHAPGLTDQRLAYPVAHHLNLAHGRAVTALRGMMAPETEFSVTLNLHQLESASDSAEDLAATRHADGVANRIFLDPMLRGGYPEDLIEGTSHLTDWSFVHDGDEAEIAAPIDFLGVNYYNPARIAATGDRNWLGTDRAFGVRIPGPRTIMDWPIVPSGLTDLLVRVHQDYGVPMMVTENGCAMPDLVGPDGIVHDDDRIAYIDGHLGAILDAVDAGVDMRGYYVWTFMDNFEWAWGYDKRFGIVHVDYDSQVRTPKDSARWFESVIRVNALPPR
ncbi:MAG: beta-glucosidase [Nocardioidaceae bacterium]|nr:beta-glucosidase [Nocardioidaceae bacterium]